jgi:methylenetetrahydrofolate reductase (NADH)
MMRGVARPIAAAASGERHRRRMAEMVVAASIEISAKDRWAGPELRDLFAPSRTVFVNYPASVTYDDIVAACARLRRAGFEPVPHVAVRRLLSFAQANDFLRRAADEAGVRSILLIGGDPDPPIGPFRDSLALLASGLIERHGIRRIAFAGHPEGHPQVAAAVLSATLRAKIALAERLGLETSIVTQFGFEAAPISRWIAGLRGQEIVSPVRVGIAGPASVASLAKFAVRCGIGASLRALAHGHTAFARILTETGPDGLIEALVAGEDAGAQIDGLHVFTLGGVPRTADWMRAVASAFHRDAL